MVVGGGETNLPTFIAQLPSFWFHWAGLLIKRWKGKLVNICQNCIDWVIIIRCGFNQKFYSKWKNLRRSCLFSVYLETLLERQLFTEGEKYLWESCCQGQTPLIIEMILKWKYDIDKYTVVHGQSNPWPSECLPLMKCTPQQCRTQSWSYHGTFSVPHRINTGKNTYLLPLKRTPLT